MNNRPATNYVRYHLNSAGVSADRIFVRSRDSTTTVGMLAYTVRSEASMAGGASLPPKLGERIGRILGDLPGAVKVDVGPDFVTVNWNGPA